MNKSVIAFLIALFILNKGLYGQTSGPSTPEVQKFTQSSNKDLVNIFSGDLNYNINILDLEGGYPINISYSSAIGMTEEASCVGFGWQINLGRITRIVRGIPDDFRNDLVLRKLYQQKEWTIGLGAGIDAEIFGLPIGIGVSSGLTFSNLRGVDLATNLGVKIAQNVGGANLSAGLSLGMSSNEGASISPNVGLGYKDFSINVGTKISRIEGIKELSFTSNIRRLQQFGSYSFPLITAKTPFTPRIDFPTSNASGSFKFRFGGEIWGFSGGAEVYGQYSIQENPIKERSLSSYGYLYLQDQQNRNSILDMATEKESPVFVEDKNLSISYLANDIFSVSAQGISGMFRPFRTDAGIVHNENIEENNVGGSLGGEFHTGGYAQVGIDVTANLTNINSGEWMNNNEVRNLCQFTQGTNGLPVYFKNVGETNLFSNQSNLMALGGTKAASFEIGESVLKNKLNDNVLKQKDLTKEPEFANTSFQFLTAAEAEQAGKIFRSYTTEGTDTSFSNLPRNEGDLGNRKPHHISYITITKEDGTVYEFGIAAYNKIQKEVSFNVSGNDEDNLFDKTVNYAKGVDDSPQNDKGRTNYFTSTETPAYAYAYLLTAVFSPDYVDLTGDGPTSDDLGTYTRFNYTLEATNFKWRTPYDNANYNPGNLCDKDDDMGSYIYGEKEIWMIHSIETKNYIAEFFTTKRADAFEVKGIEGGINTSGQQLRRIDSIKLYAKADFSGTTRTPIKTIFFSYDYSLCPGIPASSGGADSNGKLTLKKLSIRYDKSEKETQSYYTFRYNNENDLAFSYDERALDSWGNYKKRLPNLQFNTIRFPYTEQNIADAQKTSQALDLNRITLPTGGSIDIEYEAKDYAFVQDKRAMQMFKINGILNGSTSGDLLFDGTPNNTLIVDLGIDVFNTHADLSEYYNKNEKLYVNCILSAGNNAPIDKEQISGYFDVKSISTFGISQPTWIKIELSDPKNFNPLSHALWQKMRKNLTHILFPPAIDDNAGPVDNIMSVVKSIPSNIAKYISFFNSYEEEMKNDGRGKKLDTKFGSFVRLYNPNGKKIGGGCRVKKIQLSDNWDKMTNGSMENATYGQEYFYEKKIKGGKNVISSGVATYEPIGNEENPFVYPTGEFNNANALAPELYYYKTEPFGESFFPSPSIGYSQVTVREIHDKNVTRNTTGFETYEFYTAKDFPTIVNRTIKQGYPIQSVNPFNSQKKYTASQGFYVEVNDMHGKMKSHKIFSALNSDIPLSGVEYIYKTKDGQLDNQVSTINSKTGKITNDSWVGMDYDFDIATNETKSLLKSPAVQLNVDVIPAVLGLPFPVPSFLPFYSENLLQYRGVTTTKLIYRTGLIDTVIAYDNGIETRSNNILYDERSGQVVVTSSQNEFNEPYFTTNLPAHWFYDGMGLASENANRIFKNFDASKVDNEPLFNENDQLLLQGNGVAKKAWVYQNSLKHKFVIDEKGNIINNTFNSIQIIHSGRKNMQGLSAGKIISKINPAISDYLTFDQVIDASMVEFDQYWQSYYAIHPQMPILTCKCTNQDFNLNSYRIIFNSDGSIRMPLDATINGQVIFGRLGLGKNKCDLKIELDKGISNWDSCFDTAVMSFKDFTPLPAPGFCDSSFQAKGTYSVSANCNGIRTEIQRGTFILTSTCATIACQRTLIKPTPPLECSVPTGTPINPYVLGILGNWRPLATYKYVTDRNYPVAKLQKDQGSYKDFNMCLTPLPGFLFGTTIKKSTWQRKDMSVVIDPHGRSIETVDPLGVPKSELLGYGYNLLIAQADNADYYEIAYDGFEDYEYLKLLQSPILSCKFPSHFSFDNLSGGSGIEDTVSHSGKASLRVLKSSPVTVERLIDTDCNYPFEKTPYNTNQYLLKKCDVLKPFSPTPGKEYVISLWVNEPRTINELDESEPLLNIVFLDASGLPIGNSFSFKSKGPIVDNWQQANENFTIPMNAKKIKIQLSTSKEKMYVDDIRIQPFNSAMKTYAYDPLKLRLMAVLDEQNFATFYEYDGEGHLTRIKKETERGIMTVQEIRSAKPKSEKLKF